MRNISLILLSLVMIGFYECHSRKANSDQKETVIENTKKQTVPALEKLWSTEAVLKTPESVIYDSLRDVLYVSNVNEHPWEKDGNGYIARLSTDGEIIDNPWIEGFNGPKGMAIVGDTLFVADLDVVGVIDLVEERLVRKIPLEGASGLNDMAAAPDSSIYISDSNEGRIYRYWHGKTSIFDDQTPGRPNGLLVAGDHLLIAFSKAGNFVRMNMKTHQQKILADSIGAGDGVTVANYPGSYLVSDWNGEIFFISSSGKKHSLLNTKAQKSNTADICFIKNENLLLVPTFFANKVEAYQLKSVE